MLVALDIKPGFYWAGTDYLSRGRWKGGSLIRFAYGVTTAVGGWDKVNDTPLTGRPCALIGWRPNGTIIGRWLAIGTNTNAYAYDGDTVTDITPAGFSAGTTEATSDLGYGAGGYGDGLYGTPRAGSGGVTAVDTWQWDTWGEYLVGCYTADGRLLEWDLDTGNNLAVIANAPVDCIGVLTTSERMLMALGAGGDARLLQWSNVEDNTTWTPAANNTAGSLPLKTNGQIICGETVRGGILIHTDVDCHLVTYQGPPFYYGVDPVGDNCGIASAHAAVVIDSRVVWMGLNGFFLYQGAVIALPCDVHDYVFSNINRVQISKVAGWHNGDFGEAWWFYPSGASSENDRYVCWSYRENHWTYGELARTAAIGKGAWDYPIAATAAGDWYTHETGHLADGEERGGLVYLESGPLEIGDGDTFVWVSKVIHDESQSAQLLRFSLGTRPTPEGTETTNGPYTLGTNGYTDVRAQGRWFTVRLEETASGAWKLGRFRFDIRPTGLR